MTAAKWTPEPPFSHPPASRSTLPPGARALLNRMQARVEEDLARYPAFAEAIRAESAAQAEAERAAQEAAR